jgi:IS30 family transposase
MLTIHQRPFQPEDRSEAGHWEGDLIVSKDQRSAIGTLVERTTRVLRVLHLPPRDGDSLAGSQAHGTHAASRRTATDRR